MNLTNTWRFALASLAMPVLAGWPTYHGDTALRGTDDAALPAEPQVLWRFNAGSPVDNTPVSCGERIYFAARSGRITALDLAGGEVWSRQFARTNEAGQVVSEKIEAPLAVYAGTVLAGTQRGVLLALDAANGKERWRYDTGGSLLGTPNFADSQRAVVIDQSDGALHCIDMKSGRLLWKTEGVERCDGSPGVGGGRIVFGSCAAALHLFSAADGKHLKDIGVSGDAQLAGGAALEGNLIFAGTRDGSLICADAEAGDIVWSFEEAREQAFATPALAGDRVIFCADDGFVYAVGKTAGQLIWKFDTGGIPSSPVIAADKVAVSADGTLFLLDLKDGRRLWSAAVSDQISSPALIGGRVVVGADDGTVTAYGVKM